MTCGGEWTWPAASRARRAAVELPPCPSTGSRPSARGQTTSSQPSASLPGSPHVPLQSRAKPCKVEPCRDHKPARHGLANHGRRHTPRCARPANLGSSTLRGDGRSGRQPRHSMFHPLELVTDRQPQQRPLVEPVLRAGQRHRAGKEKQSHPNCARSHEPRRLSRRSRQQPRRSRQLLLLMRNSPVDVAGV